jgi:hypothetical protein
MRLPRRRGELPDKKWGGMRLTSNLWVMTYLRRCSAEGMFAVIVRHGDDYAGAIHIVVRRFDRTVCIYGPAPSVAATENSDDRRFSCLLENASEVAADTWLARQVSFDSDIWIVEVEDRDGRHLLDDQIIKT